MNLRVTAETDLAMSLEDPDEFGLPVTLIDPDGVEYDDLYGQILYDTTEVDPETGLPIIVNRPVVTLRRSSLTRIPLAGERWIARIPETPDPDATKTSHLLERAPQDGKSIGFIRLYLSKALQE